MTSDFNAVLFTLIDWSIIELHNPLVFLNSLDSLCPSYPLIIPFRMLLFKLFSYFNCRAHIYSSACERKKREDHGGENSEKKQYDSLIKQQCY